MLTPREILLVFGICFLLADALGKLPSWTWGLCLFLLMFIR